MKFSDIRNRCTLSKITDYILGNGELLAEREETDFESEMREIENNITEVLNKYFPDKETQDKFFGEIAYTASQ